MGDHPVTEAQVLAELTDVFRAVFDDDAITLRSDTTASDIPGWDSQTNITLVVATEEHFGVHFRTAEIESLRDVGEFVRLICMKNGRCRG
jgi:acyl carrier protein